VPPSGCYPLEEDQNGEQRLLLLEIAEVPEATPEESVLARRVDQAPPVGERSASSEGAHPPSEGTMFERRRQESFFKYICQEFLLDALADDQVEPDDPTRTLPNPHRGGADQEVKPARADVARLEHVFGTAADSASQRHCPTMDVFRSAHEPLATPLHTARARLKTLMATRRELPKRVEVHDLSEGAVVKLAAERKHLTNLVKMMACQAESNLLALLRPHHAPR
jgi:hypothetical protein